MSAVSGASCSASFCAQLQAMMSSAMVAASDMLAFRLANAHNSRAKILKEKLHTMFTPVIETQHLSLDDERAVIGALVPTASDAASRALKNFNTVHPAVMKKSHIEFPDGHVTRAMLTKAESGNSNMEGHVLTSSSGKLPAVFLSLGAGIVFAVVGGVTWTLALRLRSKRKSLHEDDGYVECDGDKTRASIDASMAEHPMAI